MNKYFRNVRKDHNVVIHNLGMNHLMIPTVIIIITPFLHRKEMMMMMIYFHLVHLNLPKGIRPLARTLERENKEQIRRHRLRKKNSLRKRKMTSKRLLKYLTHRRNLNLDALGVSGKYLRDLATSMGNNGTPLKYSGIRERNQHGKIKLLENQVALKLHQKQGLNRIPLLVLLHYHLMMTLQVMGLRIQSLQVPIIAMLNRPMWQN
jgi:hypothetical protein